MTRKFATLARFDAGLILPANAGQGKVLTSDANGNGGWAPIATAIPGGGNLYSGMGPPPENVGALGDYWHDTAAGLLYGPKGTQVSSPLNLHPNPSVEDPTGVGTWTSSSGAGGRATVRERTQDWAAHGVWSYHVFIERIPAANVVIYTTNTTGTVGKVPVDPAKRYSYQFTHRLRQIIAASQAVRPYIYWWKSDGTASSVLSATSGVYQPVVTGDVVKLTMLNIAPPSDAAYCTPSVYCSLPDVWDSDTDGVIWVEGATLPVEWPTTGIPIKLQGPAGGDLSGNYPNPNVVKSVGNFTVNGQLLVPTQGVAGQLLLGSDANLYRSVADVLKTDDALVVSTFAAIGQAALAANERARINSALTDPVATQYGLRSVLAYTLGSANAVGMYAVSAENTISGAGSSSGIVTALNALTSYNASGAAGGNINAHQAIVELGAAGAGITTARGIYTRIDNKHVSNLIANAYGIAIAAPLVGGALITNHWGIQVAVLTGAGVVTGLEVNEPSSGATRRTVYLPSTSGTKEGGIQFGSATPAYLYRSGGSALRTDGTLDVGPFSSVNAALTVFALAAVGDQAYFGAGGRTKFGYHGPSGSVLISDAGTSKLFRLELGAAGNLVMSMNPAGQMALPAQGAAGGILLGGDTNLYRDPAGNKLKTDDALDVALALTQAGIAVVLTNDARLSNARTPTEHAATHKLGGSDVIRLDELAVPTADVTFNGKKAVLLADPQSAQDAATKAYVDRHQVLNNLSLPTTGLYDGLIADLATNDMIAEDIRWRFVYNASTQRWEFIGGSAWLENDDTAFATTSNVYQQTPNLGMDLPYDGRYLVEYGATLTTAATASHGGYFTPTFGGATHDFWAVFAQTAAAVAITTSPARSNRFVLAGTQLAVRTALKSNTNGVSISASRRWLKITPVYVITP